ncbi:hypothetical protein, partial [Acidocella sp. MX-AZ02]|uniref:hypothetical protein n=1 Tax=Acidocella sp. MX-AZ02 TaxID=1214225 RepID=UPI001969CDB2
SSTIAAARFRSGHEIRMWRALATGNKCRDAREDPSDVAEPHVLQDSLALQRLFAAVQSAEERRFIRSNESV